LGVYGTEGVVPALGIGPAAPSTARLDRSPLTSSAATFFVDRPCEERPGHRARPTPGSPERWDPDFDPSQDSPIGEPETQGVQPMQTRTFARGDVEVTVVGYGGGPIGNIFRPMAAVDAQTQIEAAWEAGIRAYDTAPLYGHGLSEHRLGHALLGRDRDKYILSTKVGRTLTPARRGTFDSGLWVDVPPLRADFDYSYDAVLRQVDDSLQRMCQDRFDILLVHDIDRYTHGDDQPRRFAEALAGAFPALERLREEGVVRAIGVGVNEADVCRAVVDQVDIDCLLLAGRYTLLEQEPAHTLFPTCQDRGIAVLLGGVFNSGILATGPTPGAKFNYAPATENVLRRAQQLQELCRSHGVPLGAAAMNFALAHPVVKQIILGARTVDQQNRNLQWLDTEIPAALWSDCRGAGLIDAEVPAARADHPGL
jgi:D-threo-aldose 1-dehydrogenase